MHNMVRSRLMDGHKRPVVDMSLKKPRRPAFKAMAMVVLFVIALPACSGARMNPVYSQSMVEPISVQEHPAPRS